ncbi:hypothetical protein J1N35_022996 [Gossypium stocksii]|uniref:Uncharacterized protein n=1 Tax=Gossypium stocksii TaxID=47602 RepID=A0A9D3VHI0_9ROSI|nr:hypothetical protein J1N35_022996 [Gossypium stocksii]
MCLTDCHHTSLIRYLSDLTTDLGNKTPPIDFDGFKLASGYQKEILRLFTPLPHLLSDAAVGNSFIKGNSQLEDFERAREGDPGILEFQGPVTSSDGGKPPIFQEKFTFSLLEGLTEVNVVVWNINTLSSDDLIGYGRRLFLKVMMIVLGHSNQNWQVFEFCAYFGSLILNMHSSSADLSMAFCSHEILLSMQICSSFSIFLC